MGVLFVIALSVTVYMLATGAGGGYVIIPILIGLVSFALFFVSEGAKDEQAYRNRRDYWLNRGKNRRNRY